MRNTAEEGRVTFLILGNEGHFLGICREFGFVEEGKTFEEVQKKLESGAELLLEAVRKDKRFEPSLNVAPPLKYLLIYYWATFFSTLTKMYYDCVSFTSSRRSLGYA